MRRYLTTLLWYEDRLSSVRSCWLVLLSLASTTGLFLLVVGLFDFLDELAFLVGENDFRTVLISFLFVLATSAALWVLSCCLGALSRRVLLRLRGL